MARWIEIKEGKLGLIIDAYDLPWAFNFFGVESFRLHSMSPGSGRTWNLDHFMLEKRWDGPADFLSILIRPTTESESDRKSTFVVCAILDTGDPLVGVDHVTEVAGWLNDNDWPLYVDGQFADEIFPWYFDDDEIWEGVEEYGSAYDPNRGREEW